MYKRYIPTFISDTYTSSLFLHVLVLSMVLRNRTVVLFVL